MKSNYMKQLMVGRKLEENFYRTDYRYTHPGEVALQVEKVSYGILNDVSIKLHKGEILGLGGLTDCGMHDLGKIIFGLIKPEKGIVITGNGNKIHNPIKAIQNRIGYVSKDRDKEGLMLTASISDNICLPSLDKLKKLLLILKRVEKNFVMKWVNDLNIKINSIEQYCMYLSGGNKQKVNLAKWLGNESDIIILDCPARGIDVGVKVSVYNLLTELKKQGKAVLMISEELPELIGMSDRIVILKDGFISKEFKRSKDLSESKAIKYMI